MIGVVIIAIIIDTIIVIVIDHIIVLSLLLVLISLLFLQCAFKSWLIMINHQCDNQFDSIDANVNDNAIVLVNNDNTA